MLDSFPPNKSAEVHDVRVYVDGDGYLGGALVGYLDPLGVLCDGSKYLSSPLLCCCAHFWNVLIIVLV